MFSVAGDTCVRAKIRSYIAAPQDCPLQNGVVVSIHARFRSVRSGHSTSTFFCLPVDWPATVTVSSDCTISSTLTRNQDLLLLPGQWQDDTFTQVDNDNVKALHRRCQAYEALREWEPALLDATLLQRLGGGGLDAVALQERVADVMGLCSFTEVEFSKGASTTLQVEKDSWIPDVITPQHETSRVVVSR